MNWEVVGRDYPVDFFGSFEPIETLYDFDGPRIFTLAGRHGEELLAYQCGESGTLLRYVVVPCSADVITSMRRGRFSVLEALSQPWVWAVDLSQEGQVISAKQTTLSSLPPKALPRHGTLLLPSLKPLLGVRMVGPKLSADFLPASVIRRAVDGALTALKTLGEWALQAEPVPGRPTDWLRRYYDLPAQRVGFASFEVALGEPPPLEQEDMFEKDTLLRMGTLLQDALKWSTSESSDELSNTHESRVLLDAVTALAPPRHGVVTEVHVSGRLAGAATTRPYVLNRSSSSKIRRALAIVRADVRPVTHEGFVREFDKDKFTFWLRDATGTNVAKCSVGERFYDDALEAFEQEYSVTVLGHESKARQIVDVVSIGRTPEQ